MERTYIITQLKFSSLPFATLSIVFYSPKRSLNSKKYGVDLIHYTHATNTAVHSSTKVDGNINVLVQCATLIFNDFLQMLMRSSLKSLYGKMKAHVVKT